MILTCQQDHNKAEHNLHRYGTSLGQGHILLNWGPYDFHHNKELYGIAKEDTQGGSNFNGLRQSKKEKSVFNFQFFKTQFSFQLTYHLDSNSV